MKNKLTKETKNWGLIGIILAAFGWIIPYIGSLIMLTGLILHYLFYYKASRELKNKKIYDYMFYSLISSILSTLFFVGGITSIITKIVGLMKSMVSLAFYKAIFSAFVSSTLVSVLLVLSTIFLILAYILFLISAHELSRDTGQGLIFWGAFLFWIPLINIIGIILYLIGITNIESK